MTELSEYGYWISLYRCYVVCAIFLCIDDHVMRMIYVSYPPVLFFAACYVLFCPCLSRHVMSCSVLSCPVLSFSVISCAAMWCQMMSCHVLSCHVMFMKIVVPKGVSSTLLYWENQLEFRFGQIDTSCNPFLDPVLTHLNVLSHSVFQTWLNTAFNITFQVLDTLR